MRKYKQIRDRVVPVKHNLPIEILAQNNYLNQTILI